MEHFSFANVTLSKVPAKVIKIQIGGRNPSVQSDNAFQGSISCLQVYDVALNEAQIARKMNCPDADPMTKSRPCPPGFKSHQDACYKVKHCILFVSPIAGLG